MLLLDEPLGALDAKLRKRLQIELKALQEEVGITFIYVTHDQEEALTMSDRIAVMSQGQVEQVGPPQEIYEQPRTAYVADFLGVSNLMEGTAEGQDTGGCRVKLGDFELIAGEGEVGYPGASKITIRPERVDLQATGHDGREPRPRAWWSGSSTSARSCRCSSRSRPVNASRRGSRTRATRCRSSRGRRWRCIMPREALRVLPDAGTPVSLEDDLEDAEAS